MYMMELYRDNLIDLFGNTANPAKLDIKKDKKVILTTVLLCFKSEGKLELE